ncbi:MAG: PH domain-containing protein [Actinomycetota bacterium]|nr:PH domain-containing protein [Actinomycetota bacterium]
MPYPDRLLAEDEEVISRLHPHWKMLFWPVVIFLLAVGAGAFGAAQTDSAPLRYAIFAVVAIIVIVFTVLPFLRWRTTHFVVTSHRVLIRRGILARSGRDVPLSRINDVSFEHSFFERLLGCGTLIVESAGERGQVVLQDVPRVERVQGRIYQLMEDANERQDDR